MQRWQRIKQNVQLTWYNRERRKIIVAIVAGLSLLVGVGLGLARYWPSEERVVSVAPLSKEEVDAAIQAEVQTVIADLYPWILEGPVRELVAVEPPVNLLPTPTEERPEPQPTLSFEHLIWPVQGEVSTPFGWHRHAVYGDWRFNPGVEFSASGEQVRTVLDGEVVSVTSDGVETELVIDHGSGWSSIYRSIRGISVGPGELVQQNQDIALPESTGLVFFGLTHNSEPVNPQAFLR